MGRLGPSILNMKYIEELVSGDTFILQDTVYLLTCDHKASGSRLCYSLMDGTPKWIQASEMVNLFPVYQLDESNNTIPIRETKNENHNIS